MPSIASVLDERLRSAADAVGCALDFRGDLSLLSRRRRVFFVSRADKRPLPDTPWLMDVVSATRKLVVAGEVLVTCVDRIPGDAALRICAKENGSAIIALTGAPHRNADWRPLLPKSHLLIWPKLGSRSHVLHSELLQRDLLMGALADCAYASGVRDRGNMHQVAAAMFKRGALIESLQRTGRKKTQRPVLTVTKSESRNDAITDWEYLTHFTREPAGAWPGETRAEYIDWLCSGPNYQPRDAFAALCRILDERLLRGCGRLMPGGASMICFTALLPAEAKKLRRWRTGLRRWTFTPYGLAIRRETLARLGARAVRYVADAEIAAMAVSKRSFMQPVRSGAHDWSLEAEWRVAGDLDLRRIDTRELLAIVERLEQAKYIQQTYGISARCL